MRYLFENFFVSLRNKKKNIYEGIFYKIGNRFFDLLIKKIFDWKVDDYFMVVLNFLKEFKIVLIFLINFFWFYFIVLVGMCMIM